MKTLSTTLAGLALTGAAFSQSSEAPLPTYNIVATIATDSYVSMAAINNRTQIAGVINNQISGRRPFFYSPKTGRLNLPVPANINAANVDVLDINASGQIVGLYKPNGPYSSPSELMYWKNHTTAPVFYNADQPLSNHVSVGITDSGIIVGTVNTRDPLTDATSAKLFTMAAATGAVQTLSGPAWYSNYLHQVEGNFAVYSFGDGTFKAMVTPTGFVNPQPIPSGISVVNESGQAASSVNAYTWGYGFTNGVTLYPPAVPSNQNAITAYTVRLSNVATNDIVLGDVIGQRIEYPLTGQFPVLWSVTAPNKPQSLISRIKGFAPKYASNFTPDTSDGQAVMSNDASTILLFYARKSSSGINGLGDVLLLSTAGKRNTNSYFLPEKLTP